MPAKKKRARMVKKRRTMKKGKPTRPKVIKSHRRSVESLDSYESWISRQVRERAKHPTPIRTKSYSSTLPANTFENWLKGQHVVEKEKVQSSVPANSFDEWIKKQVAARALEPEEAQVNVTQSRQTEPPAPQPTTSTQVPN